jgi:hypothetical protein
LDDLDLAIQEARLIDKSKAVSLKELQKNLKLRANSQGL